MTTKASTSSSEQSTEAVIIKERRVEDQLRLRELELQTNFQVKTLSESLNLLKTEFNAWRDSVNERMEKVKNDIHSLNNKFIILIFLSLAHLSGVNVGAMARLLGG